MSALLSALAAATVNWEELKDPEVTTTKEDLLELSAYILNQAIGRLHKRMIEPLQAKDKEEK